jgi:hypothetical protein
MQEEDMKMIIDSVVAIDELEYNKYLKKSEGVISDVFSYCKSPVDDIYPNVTLNQFCNGFDIKDDECNPDDYEDENDYKRYQKDKINDKMLSYQTINSNIDNVVVCIEYPVTNAAYFKYDCGNVNVTYGLVLYLYTYSYQLMYNLEEEDMKEPSTNIPGMLNRASSNGRYGIWGHDIGDLVYNGNSKLNICNATVVCSFNCDS